MKSIKGKYLLNHIIPSVKVELDWILQLQSEAAGSYSFDVEVLKKISFFADDFQQGKAWRALFCGMMKNLSGGRVCNRKRHSASDHDLYCQAVGNAAQADSALWSQTLYAGEKQH